MVCFTEKKHLELIPTHESTGKIVQLQKFQASYTVIEKTWVLEHLRVFFGARSFSRRSFFSVFSPWDFSR